jgi:hypothetical protein
LVVALFALILAVLSLAFSPVTLSGHSVFGIDGQRMAGGLAGSSALSIGLMGLLLSVIAVAGRFGRRWGAYGLIASLLSWLVAFGTMVLAYVRIG